MNLPDRRVINIFKSFIQRVFVPQLPKMDFNCQQQWNKFNNMISNEQINLSDLQLYVDTLPNLTPNHLNINKQGFDRSQNKSPLFSKVRKDSIQETNTGFNPSKTFGGEKARMMFPLKEFEDQPADRQNYAFSKDFSKEKQDGFNGLTTQAVLPTLQKLFKTFSENQGKLQKIGYSPLPSTYEHKNFYN